MKFIFQLLKDCEIKIKLMFDEKKLRFFYFILFYFFRGEKR